MTVLSDEIMKIVKEVGNGVEKSLLIEKYVSAGLNRKVIILEIQQMVKQRLLLIKGDLLFPNDASDG